MARLVSFYTEYRLPLLTATLIGVIICDDVFLSRHYRLLANVGAAAAAGFLSIAILVGSNSQKRNMALKFVNFVCAAINILAMLASVSVFGLTGASGP